MQVAIKVLASRGNDESLTRDLFESLLSANMHHPNVVRIVSPVSTPVHFSCACCVMQMQVDVRLGPFADSVSFRFRVSNDAVPILS